MSVIVEDITRGALTSCLRFVCFPRFCQVLSAVKKCSRSRTRMEVRGVKIADEVLEELRQGRSLSEIRTKFRSAIQICARASAKDKSTLPNNVSRVDRSMDHSPEERDTRLT